MPEWGASHGGPASPRSSSRLSRLDERFGSVAGCRVLSADNAHVVVELPDGTIHTCTDLMSAFGSVNFGHANPDIASRVTATPDITGLCYPASAEELASWLCTRTDAPDDARILFQVGGSFAVSTALALAQRHRPGRIATVRGAFHGLGLDTVSITSVQRGRALQDTVLSAAVEPHVMVVEPGEVPAWDGVSCFIYEPVQGAAGYVPLEADWLGELERSAREAGVPVIADEIQAGYYRHGSLSPSQALGLTPDIRLFSKSMTNGMFPLSAVLYPTWMEPPGQHAFLSHTFQTATLGYDAAMAVARWIDSTPVDDLCRSTERTLTHHRVGLDDGLAHSVHIVGPTMSMTPTRPAREVVGECLERGVMIAAGGADFERIRIAPPLTIDPDDLDDALGIVRSALEAPSRAVAIS